jgi:predicted RNase H-like nuclease (RuvC/YqgF family)
VRFERRNLIDPKDDVRGVTESQAGAQTQRQLLDRIARLERELNRQGQTINTLESRIRTLERNSA